jgi:uncharacterized protein involved in outer membrane biogenesis
MHESSAAFASTRRPVLFAALGTLAALLLAFALCEAIGWPFLVAPMQRWMGEALERRVVFGADPSAPSQVSIHLLGGIGVTAQSIEIGAPSWSKSPHMLKARDAKLRVGYSDLLRAALGKPLRLRELQASNLDGQLERLADGRASWQFGKRGDVPDTAEQPTRLPAFGRLQVDSGSMSYRDALMDVTMDSNFSVGGGDKPTDTSASDKHDAPGGFHFVGKGSYRKQPMSVDVKTSGVLPLIADDAAALELPVVFNAQIGSAAVFFQGTASDALHLGALKGRFSIKGPSLAAVGDPIRVTLPTTGAFQADGLVARRGELWNTVFEHVSIGSSRLAGAFTYDPRSRRPLLAGRLTGSNLVLADLGPAVGTSTGKTVVPAASVSRATAALEASASAATSAASGIASGVKAVVTSVVPATAPRKNNLSPGHVIPDREFDLPALRTMDANVLVDIANLDLGSSFLEPLKPLQTHLVLAGGVLTLDKFEGRTGRGRLYGVVQLDGRNPEALWTADLRWDGARLESWIHQARGDSAPPYATGSLSGQAHLAGAGKSTAAILASLRGTVRMHLADGTISHLAVEAVGMDVAQSLGVLIKGDDALPIQYTVVDLVADQGLLKPRVLVLDTPDSTLWVDGWLSLASEDMDLRVMVTPKDFSPLALRTPVHLRGNFAKPSVSVEAGKLGTRVGASALLALVNPIAAIIPFIDTGKSDDAKRGAEACRAISKRIEASALPTASAR